MRNDILYLHAQKDQRHWAKPVLGVLGGILYIAFALVVMQIAFRVWAGMW